MIVPGVPELDIIPIYSNNDGSLTKLAAIIQEMVNIIPTYACMCMFYE